MERTGGGEGHGDVMPMESVYRAELSPRTTSLRASSF
jgi:hypothetical protein